jgi:hypothetical protein
MRHPRSLHRALSHPPRTGIRHGHRPRTAPRPDSVGLATGPNVCARSSPMSRVSGPRPPDGLDGRSDGASVLSLAAGLTTVVGALSLMAEIDTGSGVLALGVLMAAAAALIDPRLADRVLAAVLGLLLFPVLLLVALAVGLTSRGPVLVRQARDDAEIPGVPALRFRTAASVGDRLTPVGRILHGLSLDELPRLLDVARGEAPLHRTGHR